MSLAKKLGLLGFVCVAVASCDDSGQIASRANSDGFQAKYVASRTALETGKYDKALKGYARLLEESGPHEPRIRLEYAHVLLRSNAFAKAANQAKVLASQEDGAARAAALSVQGTAEHEMALAALRNGASGPEPKALLKSALAALSEVVKKHPDMDPVGSLAKRMAAIEAQLK
ncbi:tetratricopeptide repeat protein [uncultured Litoreibacter sp.]|uniref:tetratricopeptide repeat protein n=1 Tax=uncultured Litoreibacter sp. TaxID=1392394 RepID=UPI00261CA1F0|nr:tetratricopeptide repeat protein [uncultured Litoreibacter sp.]